MMLSGYEIFSLAMQIEKSGHAYYRTVAESASEGTLKEFFTYLAEQEMQHYAFFESLSESAEDLTVSAEDWESISEYIRATTESRFFLGEDKAISLAKSATDPVKAIDIAIGFEKDTLLFFYEMLSVTPPKSQAAARKIVDEEKRHIRILAEKKRAVQAGA
jgi:rubrerythrin